jgi:hypothetical protein
MSENEMLLECLLFMPNSSVAPPETRKVVPLQNGSAHTFDEWKFRVVAKNGTFTQLELAEAKKKKKKKKHKAEYGSFLFEGIGDEALRVAMDLGTSQLNRCRW